MSSLTPSLLYCVHLAAENKVLVARFDKLTGFHLSRRKHPLDNVVDLTKGERDIELEEFLKFVEKVIYLPLVAEGMPA